jgi:PAS domain S-box-containing protein
MNADMGALIGLAVALLAGIALGAGLVAWSTRRSQSEHASAATMLPIQALLDSIDDLAWIKDADSRFILVNRKFGDVFGVAPASLIGKTDFDLSAPALAEQYLQDDLRVMHTRQPSRREERITRGPDQYGWSETVKVPVLDASGRVVGTAGVARDITERRQAQEILESRVRERTQELSSTVEQLKTTQTELVTREKMAALGSMVAGIAHELNTPIGNSLLVASTLLEDANALDAQVKAGGLTRAALTDYLTRSHDGADILMHSLHKAAELITSFKQVAVDQDSERRRTFDLAQTLHEVLDTLRPGIKLRPLQLEVDFCDAVAMDSFPGPLGQVVMNVVTNAVNHAFDAMDAGVIRVSAVRQSDSVVCVSIEDNGVGIPTEHLGQIFDPFFTTKLGRGGSGLGLSISHRITTRVLGGSITVHSVLGQGTRFDLVLPIQAPSVVY